MTKIGLKLIPDPDMCIFFEKGGRAGIFNGQRYIRKSNGKFEGKN